MLIRNIQIPNRCELNPSTALDFTILILSWNFNYLREAISKKKKKNIKTAGWIDCLLIRNIQRSIFIEYLWPPADAHSMRLQWSEEAPSSFHHLGSSRVIVHPMHVHTFLGNYYFLGLPLYPNRKQLNCPRPTSITVCSFSTISRFSFFFQWVILRILSG